MKGSLIYWFIDRLIDGKTDLSSSMEPLQYGYFVLDVLDVYGGAFPLLFLALSQGIGVSYIYGVKNFIRITKSKLDIR